MERIKNNDYAEVTKDKGIITKQSGATGVIIMIRKRAMEILELFGDWLRKI